MGRRGAPRLVGYISNFTCDICGVTKSFSNCKQRESMQKLHYLTHDVKIKLKPKATERIDLTSREKQVAQLQQETIIKDLLKKEKYKVQNDWDIKPSQLQDFASKNHSDINVNIFIKKEDPETGNIIMINAKTGESKIIEENENKKKKKKKKKKN